MFEAPAGKRIGEVWFTGEEEMPLLAKYLFTSEALSIQVHPDDEEARARGFPAGKTECWYILEAEPGAVLGLGLTREVGEAELRSAALDGSIVDLVQWRPVQEGEFILVPPGTIHAIGAGLSLLEFQQNSDITYRLYDYGRPRELHLDDGVKVSTRSPFDSSLIRKVPRAASVELVDRGPFRLAGGSEDHFTGDDRWIMPMSGRVHYESECAEPGEVLFVQRGARVTYEHAWALTGVSA